MTSLRLAFRSYWLVVTLLLPLAACESDPDKSGDPDLAVVSSPDLADPNIGRACSPGQEPACPCGYICFASKCEVAEVHPACDGGT